MDSMSIDLFCATSDRMPESGPVLSGLFRTGGPSEALQGVDQAIPGHATRKSHAASTAINSSLT